jgi:PAS domain S-box-containing protein
MANKGFLRDLGLREEEVVGRHCYELTHRSPVPCGGGASECCPLEDIIATGETTRVTHEHRDAAGASRFVDIVGAPLRDSDGRIVGIIESMRDITRQKQLEAELRLRNEELEEARRRREEFTASICHELKNVLNVLSLNAAAMESKAIEETERKRAHLVVSQSRRLARLVGDMNDATAIETQRFSLTMAPCDLAAIVARSVESQQLSTVRHTILVETPDEPIRGNWDGQRLSQVVDNLISNAIKYSPSGGPIHVAVTRDGREVLVSVSDRGVGIPATKLGYLFQPYARAHREITGLGLGLFVSRGIVEAHGGRIWATSEEHRGTTLVFALPQ